MTDIRGRRGPKSNPGKDGGLKAAHLAGAEWLARATTAETVGMVLKSREVLFQPLDESGTTQCVIDSPHYQRTQHEKATVIQEGVWKDIFRDGRLIRRDSYIPMSTPGSVFLILQAILPYILFSSTPLPIDTDKTLDNAVPVRIVIEGGTNAFHSLSIEYASQVLFPMLHARLGVGPISMTLQKRGWSMGRAVVGSVIFNITPLRPGHTLPAFSFVDRGHVVKIHVSLLASTFSARTKIRDMVTEQLGERYPEVEILFPVDEDSKDSKRIYLLLVAETSNGYRLGRDWLCDEKISVTKLDRTLQHVVEKVVQDLASELAHGGCVDEYMEDQLVVFAALALGHTKIDRGASRDASLHTQTAQWVVDSLLGPRTKDGRYDGIGYKAGQQRWINAAIRYPDSEGLVKNLAELQMD